MSNVLSMAFTAVCSPNVRASTQSSRGNQWWLRDPWHIRRKSDPTRTRCGRDCSEWIVVGEMDEPSDDCCYRCLSITDKEKQ
jgi:hypothetical protein